MLFNALSVYAESANTTAATSPYGSYGTFIYLIALALIFYFILIRPQKKRDKQLKALVDQLKVGDEIVTIGGIYGKVLSIKDDTFVIESAPGNEKSKIKVARWAIKECVTIKE